MIWNKFTKPFFILAPMDDVTDSVFRQIVVDCAPPDLFFTEFVSVDGLSSAGREASLRKLAYTDKEKPLIAQVWGLKPENYQRIASEVVAMGFDGVDINMGCPVPVIVKNGACSALIKNRELAGDIIRATQKGVAGRIPVSVKTRIGYDSVDLSWPEFLLNLGIEALTIHGRTTKEMSKVPNHWDVIGQIKELRDTIAPETKLIGNGDIITKQEGQAKIEEYGLDGAMIGRGIFQDPYIFAYESPWAKMPAKDKIALFQKHIQLFGETWGDNKNPAGLKKFAKVYISGFEGASEFRVKIMDTKTLAELEHAVDDIAKI